MRQVLVPATWTERGPHCQPVSANSDACPGRAYLAPTWMPLGKEETKSVARRPLPASARHRPGKSRRSMGGMFPGQPLSAEAPVVRLIYRGLVSACQSPMLSNQFWTPTFSSNVIFDTMVLAFSRASVQSPIPDISAATCQLPQTKNSILKCAELYAKDRRLARGHRTRHHPGSPHHHSALPSHQSSSQAEPQAQQGRTAGQEARRTGWRCRASSSGWGSAPSAASTGRVSLLRRRRRLWVPRLASPRWSPCLWTEARRQRWQECRQAAGRPSRESWLIRCVS